MIDVQKAAYFTVQKFFYTMDLSNEAEAFHNVNNNNKYKNNTFS